MHNVVTICSAYWVVRNCRRYVFPAVGFAAVLTKCSSISDNIFLTVAEALSHLTSLEVRDGIKHPTTIGGRCSSC